MLYLHLDVAKLTIISLLLLGSEEKKKKDSWKSVIKRIIKEQHVDVE